MSDDFHKMAAEGEQDFKQIDFSLLPRYRRYYEAQYGHSCTPTQLCCVLKAKFKNSQSRTKFHISDQFADVVPRRAKKQKLSELHIPDQVANVVPRSARRTKTEQLYM